MDAFNFANLLNKDSGTNHALSSQAIYVVKGFDAAKKEFVYTENPNAGVATLSGNPYQIQVGLRYAFLKTCILQSEPFQYRVVTEFN